MFGMLRRKSITSLAPTLDLQSAKKRARILVIDDVESEFPFEILKREGYAIDYWPDVVELHKLETGYFDIIILDIGGVGSKLDSANEGAGILNHIKAANPSQIVIAYSGQSHESSRIPFFKVADQYVPKPSSVLAWKETIDDILVNQLTVAHYWASLRDLLRVRGISDKQISALEKALTVAAKHPAGADANRIISTTLGTVDKVATIASITGKIIMMFG